MAPPKRVGRDPAVTLLRSLANVPATVHRALLSVTELDERTRSTNKRMEMHANTYLRSVRPGTVADPEALDGLIRRGEGMAVVLPSLRGLSDHSGRVVAWGRHAQALLDAAASAVPAGSKRASMHEVLRSQREGAKLCASGSTWLSMLSKLAASAEAFGAARRALVHYSGPAARPCPEPRSEAC